MLILLFFCPQQLYMYAKIYQLLKVFNDVSNTWSDIYYSTTNLFIIESLNSVGAFDDCITQEPELISYIQVMKSKWLDYYQNISIIYLIRIIFDSYYKLNYLSDCLKTYYKYLALTIDVSTLIRD